nr:MAG TPA: hypothetical protein [Caudoviricetes sp.]
MKLYICLEFHDSFFVFLLNIDIFSILDVI